MIITNEMLFDLFLKVQDSQIRIEEQLNQIRRLNIEGINTQAGHSEESTLTLLGIKDLRTLKKHAEIIKHKGQKYFPADFTKLLASIDSEKKRPHLKKVKHSC